MRFNPKDFGSVGAGDDTEAINAAFSAIRQDGYGTLVLDGAGTCGGYQRFYDVGPLNGTDCVRTTVEIGGGVCVRGSQMTVANQAAIFDFTGAHELHLNNEGCIHGGRSDPWQPSPCLTAQPLAGVLIGGNTDKTRITGGNINGFFKTGCIAVVSACAVKIDGYTQLLNRYGSDPAFGGYAPPALMLSGNIGEWGCRSIFKSTTNPMGFVADVMMSSGEIHCINGTSPGWSLYMRHCYAVQFDRVNISNSGNGHCLFQGHNEVITFTAPKFYTEVPPVPQHVLETQGGDAVNVKLMNTTPPVLQSACWGEPVVGMGVTQY